MNIYFIWLYIISCKRCRPLVHSDSMQMCKLISDQKRIVTELTVLTLSNFNNFVSTHGFNRCNWLFSSQPSHNHLLRIFLLCSRLRPRDRVRPPTSTLHMKMIWNEYYIDWHCSNLQPVTCFKAGGYSLFMYYASWPVAHTLFPIGLLCITLGYILRSTVSTRPSSYSSHRRVGICYVTLTTDIGTSQYNTIPGLSPKWFYENGYPIHGKCAS